MSENKQQLKMPRCNIMSDLRPDALMAVAYVVFIKDGDFETPRLFIRR